MLYFPRNHMSHTIKNKRKLVLRVRRIRGQVVALEHALETDQECSDILHLLAGARGSMNSLMAELLEGHIRFHVLDSRHKGGQGEAADDLIDIVRSYLK